MTLSFGTLAVIVLAGIAGPLLAIAGGRLIVPVVVGELLAGVLVGPHVIAAVDPTNETISVLGEIGFAMLMLSAGMHVPLGDRRIGAALRRGAAGTAVVVVLAVPGGLLASLVAGTSHTAVFAVVLASASAAVLLPAFDEAGLAGEEAIAVIAQVTLADVLTIVSVPIVLQPGRLGHAVLGGLLVAAAAVALLFVSRTLEGRPFVHHVRKISKQRHWALDLRASLLILFALAWLAEKGGTSVLIAGFGAGLLVAALGGPKRLSTQMRGIAEGFFVPLYFVVLGARLNLGSVVSEPSLLALTAVLVALNVAIHLSAARVLRTPRAGALAACAQLGVPAAVATLGLSEHVLSPGEATAIVLSALASLGVCTLGVSRMVRAAASAVPAKPA